MGIIKKRARIKMARQGARQAVKRVRQSSAPRSERRTEISQIRGQQKATVKHIRKGPASFTPRPKSTAVTYGS